MNANEKREANIYWEVLLQFDCLQRGWLAVANAKHLPSGSENNKPQMKCKTISDIANHFHSLTWFPHIFANTTLHFLWVECLVQITKFPQIVVKLEPIKAALSAWEYKVGLDIFFKYHKLIFSLPTLNRSHWINWIIKNHGNIT